MEWDIVPEVPQPHSPARREAVGRRVVRVTIVPACGSFARIFRMSRPGEPKRATSARVMPLERDFFPPRRFRPLDLPRLTT